VETETGRGEGAGNISGENLGNQPNLNPAMKSQIKLFLAVAVAALAVGAAVMPPAKPPVPYNPEQAKGKVRVVLLRVDRSTVFSDAGFRNPGNKEIHAIPGIGFAYLVEAMGDEPADNWHMVDTDETVTTNGRKLSRLAPEYLAGGGHGSMHDYISFDWSALRKPVVQNERRSKIVQEWLRGMRTPSDRVDLKITTGFGKHKETFEFKNVPVN
jgi:hypothetical protein